MDDTKRLKELQFFLIRRFLLTMLVVGIAEYLISLLYNYSLVPFLWKIFFAGMGFSDMNTDGVLSVIVLLLEVIFLGLLESALPGRIQQAFRDGLLFLGKGVSRGKPTEVTILPVEQLGRVKLALLFVILFGMLIVLLLPFVLGAVHFARIVISKFREIEAAQAAKQREYEQKRNLMLSDIAHDLRTPITTVNGYAKALSDGMIPEERRREYLEAIQTKSNRISELINYLFEYVKTDSTGFSLNRMDTDLCELLRECVALSYQDLEEAGMEPVIEIPEEPIRASLDRLQFSRTITNLLTNAIRHNKAGTKVAVILQKTTSKVVHLYVADDGQKIEDEIAAHLFEPFVMADSSRSSGGGSGLGLAIAKKIMELHGFTIELLQKEALTKHEAAKGFQKAFLIRITTL